MHFSLTSIQKNQNEDIINKSLFTDIPESVDAALNLLFDSNTDNTKNKVNVDIYADNTVASSQYQKSALHNYSDTGVFKFAQYLKG